MTPEPAGRKSRRAPARFARAAVTVGAAANERPHEPQHPTRRGKFLGMDVLILHTVGRRSRQPRQSPVAWFADGPDAWLIVASGGRLHPDWYLNLMAHPERASIELPGRDPVPVTPHRLDGADRAPAWQRITAAQPRYAKYQRKTDREYPVVRLTLR